MKYGDKIVGVARLTQETEKSCFYRLMVASQNTQLEAAKIARYIKDMIGKSNKFTASSSMKRRRYQTEVVEGESLPIRVGIDFSFNSTNQ